MWNIKYLTKRKQGITSRASKLILTLGVFLLAVGGWAGAGCTSGGFLNPDPPTPTPTSSAQPSPSVHHSPFPERTPEAPETFPELQGQIQGSYSFEYQCNPYTVTLPLYQSSYQYFQSQDKYFYYQGELPDDWQAQFYLKFLSSLYDLEVVDELIDEVNRAIDQDGDELVIALVNLVQNLTYDCDKLFSVDKLGGAGYQTNFPYETLYTKTGVCGDTSILLGKILQALDYGAAFLIYDQHNHMALGIQCPLDFATYVVDQKGYCYIETTGPFRIGIKPTNIGGREFNEDPIVIPIAEGISFMRMNTLAEEMEVAVIRYGQKILQLATCQEIQLYQEIVVRQVTIRNYDNQLESLRDAVDAAYQAYQEEYEIFLSMGCQKPVPPDYEACLAQQAIVEEKFALYENKVNEYNQVVESRNGEFNRLRLATDTFNSLMDANNQSCAVVLSERVTEPEESE